MSGLAALRDALRRVHAQIETREYLGVLLVALQLLVWRFPAAEPTQLVRASLDRPGLVLHALAERGAEGVWFLLGLSALVVPALGAWLLLDPPGCSLRRNAFRISVGWLGLCWILAAAGSASPWLSGGLVGRAAVGLFALLFVSERWGAGMTLVLGVTAVAWASGGAAWLVAHGRGLGPVVEELSRRLVQVARAGAQQVWIAGVRISTRAEARRSRSREVSPPTNGAGAGVVTPRGTAVEAGTGGALR